MGLVYQPGNASFICYFNKRYALANGICSSATSFGVTVFPLLMEVLITNFGLKGTLQIISALLANICVCGFLLRPFKYQTDQNKYPIEYKTVQTDQNKLKLNEKTFQENQNSKLCNSDILLNVVKDFDFSLFRRVHFLLQGVLNGILYSGCYGFFIYLYPYSVSVGIPNMKSSFLMSTIGICHLIARLLPLGYLVDKKIIRASTLAGTAFLICGVGIIVLSFMSAFKGLVVLVSVFGITQGIGGSFIIVVMVYSAGSKEKASGATSWMLLHFGIGNLVAIYGCGKLNF